MIMKGLSGIEKKAYKFIKDAGEVQTTNLPKRMWGAIPNLENMGFVEVFKKYTSYFRSRKKKFVKLRTERKTMER